MRRRVSFVRSLIGKKIIMAVTGLVLFLFVVAHLLGNLKVFEGPQKFDAYAEGLRTVGAPFFGRAQILWGLRVALLLSVAAHLWAALAVTRASWQARPVGYRTLETSETTYAARSMRWGGIVIACYVVYHLLDLTFGPANPSFIPGDAYHNLVASLARAAHCRRVRRGCGRGRAPHLSRPLERPANVGGEPAADLGVAARRCGRRRRRDRRRLHRDRGRRARGGGAVSMNLDARIPEGPLDEKWRRHRAAVRLVAPANKPKYHVIVVGSGLAGASAAASLAELGYRVSCFCFQDSPRRAHSIAAQGGINAAKNYQNDGDSVFRLFADTIKGGDFRSREANVYRLAEISASIIDQCVGQGVPFAREYGGRAGEPLVWRRAGLTHVLRSGPDRPAVAAGRVPGAGAADRARRGKDVRAA